MTMHTTTGFAGLSTRDGPSRACPPTASCIRARLEEAGVLRPDGSIDQGAGADVASWKHVWSAGQGVGHVRGVEPTAAILDRLAAKHEAAR